MRGHADTALRSLHGGGCPSAQVVEQLRRMTSANPASMTDGPLQLRVVPAIVRGRRRRMGCLRQPGGAGRRAGVRAALFDPFRSKSNLRTTPITHSFRMIFCTHWKPPARLSRGPAGSPSICVAESRGRRRAGRRALLSEIAFARRIRVRPRLGRGLRARRRQLLPEAPGVGAVHAGDRPAPAGARRAPRPSRCAPASPRA